MSITLILQKYELLTPPYRNETDTKISAKILFLIPKIPPPTNRSSDRRTEKNPIFH